MTSGFIVRRDGNSGLDDRVYALVDGRLKLVNQWADGFAVSNSESITEKLETYERNRWPNVTAPITIEAIELDLGGFYPGIARPKYNVRNSLFTPGLNSDFRLAKSVWRELTLATHDLEQCFNVNAITEENFGAFGTHYERIIYISCIGMESLFRRILVENAVAKARSTTNDFVRLGLFMRLPEAGISLVRYPWIPEIKPFEGWSVSDPTSSLPWFAAYNSLKHAKQENLYQASMKNALIATAAYYILAYFSFGDALFPGLLSTDHYFEFDSMPDWKVSDMYFQAPDLAWHVMSLSI